MGIIKKDTQFEGQMRGQKWKGGEQNPELSLQQFLTKEAEGDARNTGTWAERGETVRMTERGETLERGREGTERFPLPFAAEGAHLARDVFAWSGCAITLELTYLAQSLREVSHCFELVCVRIGCNMSPDRMTSLSWTMALRAVGVNISWF